MAARISSNQLRTDKSEHHTQERPSSSVNGRAADPVEVARSQDALRRQIGPIGVPVRELIDEGRR